MYKSHTAKANALCGLYLLLVVVWFISVRKALEIGVFSSYISIALFQGKRKKP